MGSRNPPADDAQQELDEAGGAEVPAVGQLAQASLF